MKNKANFTQKTTGKAVSDINEKIKRDYSESNSRLISLYPDLANELSFS